MKKVDLEILLETGAHFGHQNRRWNPKMEEYIFGVKNGVRVFDLIKTKIALDAALAAITKASSENKVILFIGTKKQIRDKVRETGKELECPYVDIRWLGGTLSNFDQMKKSIRTLKETKKNREEGKYSNHTKKERLMIDRKISKMETRFGGISDLEKIPDMMIIIDTHRERSAIYEASALGVETVGIVDSNADPAEVNWPVPMNDDAAGALEYVLDLFKQAVVEGRKKKPKKK